MNSKTCTMCGVEKQLDEFQKNSSCVTDGRRGACKECYKPLAKKNDANKYSKWKNDRQVAMKMSARSTMLSVEEITAIYESQGGLCAICKTENPRHLDHDHSCCPSPRKGGPTKNCGKCVRGFLCQQCNHALGLFYDDKERIVQAVTYLEKKLADGKRTTHRVSPVV